MSWETRTVVEVRCDTCGQRAVDDDNAFWYADRDTAREVLTGHGWAFVGDNRDTATCHDCVQRAACALVGHDWDGWIDRTYAWYIGRTRTCLSCGTTEHDPPSSARPAEKEPAP